VIQTFFIDHVLKARTFSIGHDSGGREHIGLCWQTHRQRQQIAFADQISEQDRARHRRELRGIEARAVADRFAPIHHADARTWTWTKLLGRRGADSQHFLSWKRTSTTACRRHRQRLAHLAHTARTAPAFRMAQRLWPQWKDIFAAREFSIYETKTTPDFSSVHMLLERISSAMAATNRASASWYSSAKNSTTALQAGLPPARSPDALDLRHPEHVVALDAPDQPPRVVQYTGNTFHI